MSANRLSVLARTLKHLRGSQMTGQLRYRLSGPAIRPRASRVPGAALALPAHVGCIAPDSTFEPGGVQLLGLPAHDPTANGWDAVGDPLWLYTLHYHGWLCSPATSHEAAVRTITTWIEQHTRGVGWEPYPTSLRLMHWTGWLVREQSKLTDEFRTLMAESMAAQVQHLAANLETHIDGNHLWTNLAALSVCSMLLRSDGLPRPGEVLEQFASCVGDQVGGDGVHRERTPTYHCIVTEQLAMVLSVASFHAPSRVVTLAKRLQSMLEALRAFTHPDGDVALWGDSQLGAPANPEPLLRKAGIQQPLTAAPIDAHEAGFSRRVWGPWTVMLNRGDIAMPHQPGHIHGDALAVELSFGSTRVLVDAGTGTYRPGAERRYARSTPAHNTVTLDTHPEHHEMWASHRVGGRADVRQLVIEPTRWAASVTAFGAPSSHTREVERVGDMILIRDTVEPCAEAIARFFLPTTLGVELTPEGAMVTTPHGRFEIVGSSSIWWLEPANGWRAIGVPASRVCLATRLEGGKLTTVFAPRG